MLLKVAVLTLSLLFLELIARPGDEKFILPKQLTDIEGKTIDIAKLANDKKLFIVTLKATGCSVCFSSYYVLKTD